MRGVVLKRYRVENQKVQLVTHAYTPAVHGPTRVLVGTVVPGSLGTLCITLLW